MISDFFLSIFIDFISFIAGFFTNQADVTLPPQIASSITSFNGLIASLDVIFPVSTLLIILSVYATFEAVYIIYKVFRWGYQKIPGIS